MHKDKNEKTQVHRNGCPRLGERGTFECVCPLRPSYKTVDSYHIGKLRAIFHAIGRNGEWDRRLGLGNPAADKSVKDYLRLVTAEQLQARVTPKQASPFFVDKLAQLSDYIDRNLQSPNITPTQRFVLARDQAYFKAAVLVVIGLEIWAWRRYQKFWFFLKGAYSMRHSAFSFNWSP